jgi:hypothetical protein
VGTRRTIAPAISGCVAAIQPPARSVLRHSWRAVLRAYAHVSVEHPKFAAATRHAACNHA